MDSRLYNAVISGDMNVLVQDMDRVGVQVTIINNTVLHLASLSGKIECVREILSKHPSLLRQVNSTGDTALHLAARNGHSTVVQALIEFARTLEEGLESGVGVAKEMLRMTNDKKDTALHEAVRNHHFDVVKLLTQEDPDFPHSVNTDNETPLYIAAKRGYDDLVSAILETCTSPTYGGSDGRTALHGAIISRSAGITRKLLEWNQSLIKEVDEYGRTPLHYAAFLGDDCSVCEILRVDKSVACIGDKYDKNTAHHLAASKGFVSAIKSVSANFKSFVDEDTTHLSHTRAVLNSRLQKRERERERYKDYLKPMKAIVERLKKAAETHVIVAALIATVTFTAGFTIPGGYNQNESELNYGMAILSRAAAFQAFMVTDTLALLFSTIAIVIYFGIPTLQGRKLEELAEEEKVKGLMKEANWYMAAAFTVVVAIIAMMIAFVTGTYVVLAHSPALAIATCVVGSSSSLILFVIFYKLLDPLGFLRALLNYFMH